MARLAAWTLLLVTRTAHALLMPAHCRKWASSARAFNANGGILYMENFLDPVQFEAVSKECRSLRKFFKRELDSIATGRMGCCVDSRSELHRSVMSDALTAKLSCVTGRSLFPSEYPVEVRLYTTKAEMGWHRDDTLYTEPQTEVVLTLDNNSDSYTQWLDPSGERHERWTAPNSAIVVRMQMSLSRFVVDFLVHFCN